MLMTTTKQTTAPLVRREVEIEALLHFAYRDELPKRTISSAEAIWRNMEISGPYGQIDNGNAAQRYDFGEPHRDAIAIERAVEALPFVVIDWAESLDAIMGDLAPLVNINDLRCEQAERGRVTQSSWPSKTYSKARREQSVNAPRDVLLLGSINAAALVASHAHQGTRPQWHREHPTTHATPPRGPGEAMIVGECRGKNLYATGTHCPITWRPSPITIAQHRADYIAWWRGLATLAEWLDLSEHVALPPSAPRLPWFDAEPEPVLYGQPMPPRMQKLLLKPERPLAGRTRGQAEDVAKRYPGRRVER